MSKPEPSVQAGAREWLRARWNGGRTLLDITLKEDDLAQGLDAYAAQQVEALRAALDNYEQLVLQGDIAHLKYRMAAEGWSQSWLDGGVANVTKRLAELKDAALKAAPKQT